MQLDTLGARYSERPAAMRPPALIHQKSYCTMKRTDRGAWNDAGVR
jgi:hypothetical protein